MKFKKIAALVIVAVMLVSTVPATAVGTVPEVKGFYFQPVAGGVIYHFEADELMGDGADDMKALLGELLAISVATETAGMYVSTVEGVVEYDSQSAESGKDMAAQLADYAQLTEPEKAAENKASAVTGAYTVKDVAEEDGAFTVTVQNKDGLTGTIEVENPAELVEDSDFDAQDGVGLVATAEGLTITAIATVSGITADNAVFSFKTSDGTLLASKSSVITENKATATYTAAQGGMYEIAVTLDDTAETKSETVKIVLTAPAPPAEEDEFEIYVNGTALSVSASAVLESLADALSGEGDLEEFEYSDGAIIFTAQDGTETILTKTAPIKARTAPEYYVTIEDGTDVFYIAFEDEPNSGPDGRTSKYLCAVTAPAAGYTGWLSIDDAAEYKFGFLFGQDPLLAGMSLYIGPNAVADADPLELIKLAIATIDPTIELKYSPENGFYVDDSDIRLTETAPEYDRTSNGEFYLSISDGAEKTYYIAYETRPDDGSDGRTSKYLCAVAAATPGYDDWFTPSGYGLPAAVTVLKFGFLFGQEAQ